ncbi:MAG: class I SAM-dependent methyltransferase [Planctomycetota bacterium]|nr:class I SAM-dependent methyltransferase [Planctomycetota bacterium]
MELVEVACAVCGNEEAEPVYSRAHETGSALGRLTVRLVLCRCGFLYANPRPSRTDLQAYYEGGEHASGATYHEVCAGSRHSRLSEQRAAFLARWLAELAGGTLLDVGCGRGDLLAMLDLPRWGKVGLEPSPAAAAAARARGIEVIEARLDDHRQGSFDPMEFDAVACISVLEHAFDPRVALERLAALLAPDGLLFLEVPDSLRPVPQIAEFFSFEHLSHFTSGSLERLLSSSGFETLALERDEDFSGLRACARKIEGPVETHAGDREELERALNEYQAARAGLERDLQRRLAPWIARWEAESKRVAIFGAGVHTRFLLDLIDFGACVACVLDSDPAKRGTRFLRWDVHGPDEAAALGLDAIVVSSQAYQEEMLQAVAHLEGSGVELVGCYP